MDRCSRNIKGRSHAKRRKPKFPPLKTIKFPPLHFACHGKSSRPDEMAIFSHVDASFPCPSSVLSREPESPSEKLVSFACEVSGRTSFFATSDVRVNETN